MTKEQTKQQGENKRVVLVTGGGTGIGRAICVALAGKDRHVYVHYGSSAAGAEETVRLIVDQGYTATAIQTDLKDEQAIVALVNEVRERSGSLDILVNNAGIVQDQLLIRMSDDAFDDVIRVNQKAPFLLMREAAKLMIRRRYGRIINITSIVGLKGNAGQANYAAAKAALLAMSKSAALELASRNITVNCVAPGFIETPMTQTLSETIQKSILEHIPLKRYGKTADVAALVRFLASDEAAYITAQSISVDGGMNH